MRAIVPCSRRAARLALAAVDGEGVLEVAELAVGLAVVAQRRAAGRDRVRRARRGPRPPASRPRAAVTSRGEAQRRDPRPATAPRRRRCCRGPPPPAGRSSTALTGVAPAARAARRDSAPSKPLPSGSGPSPASSRCASSSAVGQRSTAPKRRASLKVTRAPPSMSSTTWSCFSGAGCAWWNAPTCAPETSSRPDMPRCTISVSPRSRSASRYFDRRRSAGHPRAGQPLAPAAAGTASAGRAGGPRRARSRRPASTGSRPRRTVSTSGSSGTCALPRSGAAVAAAPGPAL